MRTSSVCEVPTGLHTRSSESKKATADRCVFLLQDHQCGRYICCFSQWLRQTQEKTRYSLNEDNYQK